MYIFSQPTVWLIEVLTLRWAARFGTWTHATRDTRGWWLNWERFHRGGTFQIGVQHGSGHHKFGIIYHTIDNINTDKNNQTYTIRGTPMAGPPFMDPILNQGGSHFFFWRLGGHDESGGIQWSHELVQWIWTNQAEKNRSSPKLNL